MTRDEVIAELEKQHLREKLSAEEFELAVAEALRPARSIRATTTSGPSPAPAGMKRPTAFLPLDDEAQALKAERLAAHRVAEVPPDPLELELLGGCRVCGGARFTVQTSNVFDPMFGVPVPCAECAPVADPEERLARAHIPAVAASWRFETFRSAHNPAAARAVYEWDGLTSLVISGAPGRGKTHLATSGLRREIEERGRAGRFVYTNDLLEETRRRYDKREGLESAQAYTEAMIAWPLLLLDDFGVGVPTPWVVEQLTSLIDARTRAGHVTLITTNLADTEAVESHYTVEGNRLAAERLASRLGPRLYEWVRATGPDMRQYAE